MQRNDAWVVGGASIFILIGGAILALGVCNLSRAVASRHWPTTAAVVAQSDTSADTQRTVVGLFEIFIS